MVVGGSVADTAGRRVTVLGQEFPDEVEGVHGKSDLAEEDGLDGNEGDDTKEQRNESSEFQLQEEKERDQLLDLLLLLATGCKEGSVIRIIILSNFIFWPLLSNYSKLNN